MNDLKDYNAKIFEEIKHLDENGNEYWDARELMKALGYSKWENFNKVIEKAKIACELSNYNIKDCFPDVRKPITSGKGKIEIIDDYYLTRYACYLIAQNGDSRKEVVALAQTYFAIQTRRMELTEQEYNLLSEDDKRLYRRQQTKDGNKALYKVASAKGVKNFDKFTNAGYRGLYNGEDANMIAKRKGVRYREDILDKMGSVELGANVFRISLTEDLLSKQKEQSEEKASNTHYNVGKAVRNTIKKLGGTMPEELPTPEKSIKELENNKLKINN